MMQPLSRKKRIIYFIFFFFVFVVVAPLFILDAKGYRFSLKDVIKVSQTGGIYVGVDQSGLEIYVNGELVRKTSIVQKSIFIQDLKPETYEVKVSKDGLQTWNKSLKVFPEIVTEARPFLLKSETELIEITRFLERDGATSTRSQSPSLKNPDYDIINILFSTTTISKIATTTKIATTSSGDRILGDVFVRNENGSLHVLWAGDEDSIPGYFCESSACKLEIIIKTNSPVKSFEFFPGRNDLLIIRLEGGIYVSEIDDRSPQNIQKIVDGVGYDFRIKDGNELYLKKDAKLYLVSI